MDFAQYQRELDRLRGDAPWNLVVVKRAASTNTLARRIVQEYHREYTDPPRAVIVALEQTAGKGRQGRRWQSPAGEGIYATLVLPVEDPSHLARLPLLAAVGLARALNRHLAEPCRLKWPNDLMVEGRKIGGLLIEALTCEGDAVAMIGFGINHRGEVPLEGERRATSVTRMTAQAPGETPPMPTLCWRLVAEIDRALQHLPDGPWAVERYRELILHRPGDRLRCRVAGREHVGIFRGIDDHGFLRLEEDGKEERLSAGEVVEEVREDD
jgi:BirA family biotin operon repressor/biotin-[acetyl-CoA-carboxylase] ligase